jgi:hypothetical protein
MSLSSMHHVDPPYTGIIITTLSLKCMAFSPVNTELEHCYFRLVGIKCSHYFTTRTTKP